MVAFIVRLYNNGPALWTTFLTTYWFWITVFTIVLVALPWAWVAKVAIDPKASPSGRVSLLRFPGNVTSGLYGRISRGSLTEWHVFGCFSESESAADSIPHHYMLCSAVGGFTKELVANPPTALYTRTIKLPGFSYCHRMYNGGVAICTGAAIGVFISLFSNKGLSNFSLIWVGSKFEATYGKQVLLLCDSLNADIQRYSTDIKIPNPTCLSSLLPTGMYPKDDHETWKTLANPIQKLPVTPLYF